MDVTRPNRREFLAGLAAASLFPACATHRGGENLPPVRAITRGPKFHWFGYYDKLEFDPTSRYVLSNEVDFQGRPVKETDVLKVGMVDLEDGDRWIELGETRAWSWQKGCMLQWLPGSKTEVIWNDREGDHFVSHILDVKTRAKRTLPAPIYGISPDSRWAVTSDFRRIYDCNPGYGYPASHGPDQNARVLEDSGVWRMDLDTGKRKLLFSIADIAKIPNTRHDWPGETGYPGSKHWLYCLLVSPDAKRFIFLHCWGKDGARGGAYWQRMFTANDDGTDLYLVNPGDCSHFFWRDPQHIVAWTYHPSHGPKVYLFEDRTPNVQVVGPNVITEDGHFTFLPDNRWLVGDTYPDAQRKQNPYLFNMETETKYPLGHFYSPPEFNYDFRCDNHPRFSPDGKKVVIDSPHGGDGRQSYLIDISQIVNAKA
jgi:hypothetical protein